ncbi:MAG TPA: riboflavin kinase [Ktedonobacterales bacterium]
MKTHYAVPATASRPAAVVALSDFDGMLTSHHELLAQAHTAAQEAGLPLMAGVLWGGASESHAGTVLTPLDARLALLSQTGLCDSALVLTTAPDAASATPASLADALRAHVTPGEIMIGALAAAWGSPEALASALTAQGLSAHVLEPLPGVRRITHEDALAPLLRGDVREVAALLGRLYSVSGIVVPGDRRGRLLGFPTANLRLDGRLALPANGIYAALVALPGQEAPEAAAVVSLGVRPQFGEGNPRLFEVFILDVALDLYGLPIRVYLVERLRDELKFESVEALITQMRHDVERSREVLALAKIRATSVQ